MSNVAAFRAPKPMGDVDERELRVQLAACYRLIAHFGMADLIYTHISARVPGHADQFLINPYGLMFHEITASSLVKIDHEGSIVEDSGYPVNKAGFVIHSAIHAGRPDVHCVLHTHTRAGVAVSCLEEGLLPLNQIALDYYDRVAYHDYEGIALDLDEQQRLIADLGDKPVMILRNHGLLTAAATVPAAFELMYYLEMACKIQVDVMASGGKMILPPATVQERTAGQYTRDATKGMRAWPALLRLLDAKDPSFRD
jgi:ribulose-5-phosphate 4-epimerase/fuculose-1-phosphate aldolase